MVTLRKWEVLAENSFAMEIVEATNCFVHGSLSFAIREGKHYRIVKAYAPGAWITVNELLPSFTSVTPSETAPDEH